MDPKRLGAEANEIFTVSDEEEEKKDKNTASGHMVNGPSETVHGKGSSLIGLSQLHFSSKHFVMDAIQPLFENFKSRFRIFKKVLPEFN